MNTNLLNIKTILTSICLLFFSLDGYAGHWEEESSPYKKRVANYQQFWESLIPTYSKIQYAGGMGLISGRKAFQKPMNEGVELLHAIQDVYLDASVTIA